MKNKRENRQIFLCYFIHRLRCWLYVVYYTRRNGCDAPLTFLPAAHTVSFRYKENEEEKNGDTQTNHPNVCRHRTRAAAKQRYINKTLRRV